MLALQALCLYDALGDSFTEQLDTFLADPANRADLHWRHPLGPQAVSFARELAAGTWQQRAASDQLLTQHVVGWSLDRMQPVDRNILRLGLYELLHCPDRPYEVVINEAIELARRFGGAESPAFVNGVLDGLRREHAARQTAATPDEGGETAGPRPNSPAGAADPGNEPQEDCDGAV